MDLFRQAAEKYALKTSHDGWTGVLDALEEGEGVPIVPISFSFPCLHGIEMETLPLFGLGLISRNQRKIT